MKRNPFKLKSGNKSAFKELGSTPASSMSFQDLANKVKDDANRLHDNLQGVGESVKEFKKTRKDKVTDKAKASEDGLTNFERRRAEKKSRNPGESKFKADIRRKQEARKAAKSNNTKTNRTSAAELNKPTDKEIKVKTKNNLTLGSSKNKNIEAPKSEYGDFLKDTGGNPNLAMSIMANQDNILNDGYFGVNKKGKKDILGNPAIVKTRVKGKNVAKPKTKVAGALGSKTRKEQYDAKGWRYDDTIKGYNRDGTEKKKKVEKTNKSGGKEYPINLKEKGGNFEEGNWYIRDNGKISLWTKRGWAKEKK